MRKSAICIMVFTAISVCAFAQTSSSPIIESRGTATETAVADYAEFRLTQTSSAATFRECVEQLLPLDDKVKQEIENRKLEVADVQVSGVGVSDTKTKVDTYVAERTIRLRFRLGSLTQSDEDITRTVALFTDVVTLLATSLSCSIDGPFLGINDERALLQDAVASAVEEAFPAAEGAAGVLQTAILEVQRVIINETTWNTNEVWKPQKGELNRVACTAKVTVHYLFSSPEVQP